MMNPRVSYDQEFDILYLNTGEQYSEGASLLAPALSGIAVEIKTDDGHDYRRNSRPQPRPELRCWGQFLECDSVVERSPVEDVITPCPCPRHTLQ